MTEIRQKRAALLRRKRHVRRRVVGTPGRPRLSVYRSLRHIYAQVIDDLSGKTLASASTLSKEVREEVSATGNCAAAAKVGALLAERAREAGVEAVCFDRGGRKFHGRVKALAEAAREAGLRF
ncbi:MAG: 50S ribosomal protein L18 [Planctomycetota bacterium]|nr:50S ribosomal protein L18 [Planctomycetota bacterium]